jgi:hypothetical protein
VPPLSTTVPVAIPPDCTISTPPLLTTVPLTLPLAFTNSIAPLSTMKPEIEAFASISSATMAPELIVTPLILLVAPEDHRPMTWVTSIWT